MAGLATRKPSQPDLATPRTRVDNEEGVELKYKLGKELGRGAFGVVLEGTQLSSGQVFAVKVIPKERVSEAVRHAPAATTRVQCCVVWDRCLCWHPLG